MNFVSAKIVKRKSKKERARDRKGEKDEKYSVDMTVQRINLSGGTYIGDPFSKLKY